MSVYAALSEEECYLWAILSDPSGIDQMEFMIHDSAYKIQEKDGSVTQGLFRAWPFQVAWWRDRNPLVISQGSRSAGKSLSCCAAALAFPFCYPGEEMVITAPENVHLQALTDKIETMYVNNRVPKEMLVRGVHGIKHKPYLQNFSNGARIMGRIPQRDGRGVKGVHPAVLLLDEACFTGDTLILTERGQVPIKDVLVGDRVLTHKGNWKRVLGNYDKGEREVVSVKGQGHWGLRCTPNHHFWGKRILDWHDRKNQHGMKEVSEFTWIPADELENAALWASPMTVPWEGEVPTTIQSKRGDISILTTDFMWCLGLYAAEGSTSSSYGSGGKENKSTWSIHVNEVTEVVDRLRQAGLAPLVQPVQNTANCMNVVCCGVDLAGFLDEHIGVGCYNKKVPGWVYGLSSELRSAFFEGVMYGDGCKSYDARYTHVRDRLSTTSRLLAVGVKLLALSLGKFVSIHYREGGSCSIRGKMFTSGPSWEVVTNDSGQGLTDEGVRLTKVKHVRIDGLERVYDLEVEDDHSFIADGIIVHNSDYPELAWNELIETVNQSSENAQWKAFGVTRGVRDKFYEYTTSDNWKVYRLPAMFRPTWSDEERAAKVAQYGSEDNVDYRRNILGVHSDAASPLFSAMQLGRCFIGETQVSVIVEDERLEAGHHIALTPISDVSIGDVVLNAVGSGTVINKIASEHDEIYEIRVQGESIYGTGDHPVFTRRGWVPIRDLTTDDEIVTADGLPQLWEGLSGEGQDTLLKSLYG